MWRSLSPHLRCFFFLCCRILFSFGVMGMKKRVSSVTVCMRKKDQGPTCIQVVTLQKTEPIFSCLFNVFHGCSSEHICVGEDVCKYINTWYHELIYFVFCAGRSKGYQEWFLPAVQLHNATGVQHPYSETLPSLVLPSLEQPNPPTHIHRKNADRAISSPSNPTPQHR